MEFEASSKLGSLSFFAMEVNAHTHTQSVISDLYYSYTFVLAIRSLKISRSCYLQSQSAICVHLNAVNQGGTH